MLEKHLVCKVLLDMRTEESTVYNARYAALIAECTGKKGEVPIKLTVKAKASAKRKTSGKRAKSKKIKSGVLGGIGDDVESAEAVSEQDGEAESGERDEASDRDGADIDGQDAWDPLR